MKPYLIPFTAITLILSSAAIAQTSSTTTPASPATQPGAATTSPATTDTVRPAAMNNGTAAPGSRAMRDRDSGDEKDRLEKVLAGAQGRGDYAKMLEKEGYRISSINSDKPSYLEYEIVKGGKSFEVQLDFDDKSPKATKIDVTTNMWRADSTKQMMKDPNYKSDTAMVADPQGRHSDRQYMKAWNNEKEKLEQSMKPGQSVDAYKKQIEGMGYRITSVNDRDKDYVEYEIVKGQNSYEVQIDLDSKTQMGKEIDVTTNVWEADSTERAKGDK